MRWKFTIILLLLNIAAAFYLYHLESGNDLQGRLRRNSRLVIPATNNIDRLSIELRGEDGSSQTRVLAKQRTQWELLEPMRWPANENAIQNILSQLDFLSEQVAIPLSDIERSGQSLADYGLDHPRVIIRYHTIDNDEGEIRLGATTKMGRRVYLLPPDGKEVLVVQEDLLNAVALPLSSLRSHRIFEIPPFEIQSLAVQAGEQRIRLVKTADKWQFETPVSAPADSELVENTLNMLYGQQALRLLGQGAINPDLAGLRNPRMRVSIGGNNRRQTLVLGSTVPTNELPAGSPAQAYARIDDSDNEGTIFTVFEGPFEHLKQAPDQLRERNFLTFNPAAVNSIQISRGGSSLNLQKLEQSNENEAPTWQALLSGQDSMVRSEKVDTLRVDELLSQLSEVSAIQFISDSPSPSALESWGLETPIAQVRLRGADGLDTTLFFGNNLSNEPYLLYAKTRNGNSVYAVESRILSALQTTPLSYRNRTVQTLPADARITAIRILELPSEKVLYSSSLSSEAETWAQALQSAPEDQRLAVLGLIDTLKNFTVSEYLANGTNAPESMPWRYRLEAEVQLPANGTQAASGQTISYLFTAREGLTQIGASPAADLTFTLNPALVDYLTPLSADLDLPSDMPVTPEAVKDAPLPPMPTANKTADETADKAAGKQTAATAQAPQATSQEAVKADAPAAQPAQPQQAATKPANADTAPKPDTAAKAPAEAPKAETPAAPTEAQPPQPADGNSTAAP